MNNINNQDFYLKKNSEITSQHENVLSFTQMIALCEIPDNLNCAMRNDKVKEVVLLMGCLGLRVSEAINFTWEQINIEDKKGFLILGKGRKKRIVYNVFNSNYISKKSNSNVDDKWNKISRVAIWKHLKKRSLDLKLDWLITPHTLRRSFASILQYDYHFEPATIQQLIGHEQFATTEKYLKKDPRFVVNSLKRKGIIF